MKRNFHGIAKKYRLKLIILFGSLVSGNIHRESDADIAIVPEKALSLQNELSLRNELFRVFRRAVDLVDLKRASPLLLGQIAKSGKLLYGHKREFIAFRIYAMKRYIDFEPYFRLREKTIHHAILNLHA